MTKPVILTGLRANNDLHIGNYLGALMPLVDMANQKSDQYQVNIFVPDLHSFTTPIDHSVLYDQIINNLKVYVAAGLPLDNADVHIYRQSFIPAHSELTWILDCFTGFGELQRMTQFKDKSASKVSAATEQDAVRQLEHYAKSMGGEASVQKEANQKYRPDFVINTADGKTIILEVKRQSTDASVGLFNYPVLMAADILLYSSSYVPVGEDQSQHVEFARDIAGRMNNQFGELFVVPKPVKVQHEFFGKDQALRIKDLIDPTKKMSKSDETGRGVIFLSDAPDAARKKIMSATTDSLNKIAFNPTEQPGVTNLLTILALFSGKTSDEVLSKYAGQEQYGPLKTEVADVVAAFLADFQTKHGAVDEQKVLAKLESDETLMNEQANATLLKVQKAVGLRR